MKNNISLEISQSVIEVQRCSNTEYTKESYEAAAKMSAGIVEFDVIFTSDGVLVCRHLQCGLHTTTNILVSP